MKSVQLSLLEDIPARPEAIHRYIDEMRFALIARMFINNKVKHPLSDIHYWRSDWQVVRSLPLKF